MYLYGSSGGGYCSAYPGEALAPRYRKESPQARKAAGNLPRVAAKLGVCGGTGGNSAGQRKINASWRARWRCKNGDRSRIGLIFNFLFVDGMHYRLQVMPAMG